MLVGFYPLFAYKSCRNIFGAFWPEQYQNPIAEVYVGVAQSCLTYQELQSLHLQFDLPQWKICGFVLSRPLLFTDLLTSWQNYNRSYLRRNLLYESLSVQSLYTLHQQVAALVSGHFQGFSNGVIHVTTG